MARGQIIVETSQLDAISTNVSDLADKYSAEYTTLYKLVSEMQSAWSGVDNTAYTTQIEGFKDDFQKMEALMREYASFLKDTASKYRETQASIISKAQQLQTNA